jgi:hypothetical protein
MNPFISDFIDVRDVPDMGFGVFTTQDIDKDCLIEVSPIFTYPRQVIDTAYYILMAEGAQPGEFKLDQYSLLLPGNYDKCAIMLGYLSIYNHSDNPNAELTFISERKVAVKTTQPIPADSQIFISYGSGWFESKKSYIQKI